MDSVDVDVDEAWNDVALAYVNDGRAREVRTRSRLDDCDTTFVDHQGRRGKDSVGKNQVASGKNEHEAIIKAQVTSHNAQVITSSVSLCLVPCAFLCIQTPAPVDVDMKFSSLKRKFRFRAQHLVKTDQETLVAGVGGRREHN